MVEQELTLIQSMVELLNFQTYFQDWLNIATGNTSLLGVAEKWQKQEFVALFVLLTWLSSWIVDIVKLQCLIEEQNINNPDFKIPLQAFAERLELSRLYLYYDKVLRSRAQLATQANKLLLVETLLIDWLHLNSH